MSATRLPCVAREAGEGSHAVTVTTSITVRKRPIEVEAWQYNGADNLDAAPAWVREYRCQLWDDQRRMNIMHPIKPDMSAFDMDWYLRIPTLEGIMLAGEGDWLILGIKGEVYPCKPEIFEETYERVALANTLND